MCGLARLVVAVGAIAAAASCAHEKRPEDRPRTLRSPPPGLKRAAAPPPSLPPEQDFRRILGIGGNRDGATELYDAWREKLRHCTPAEAAAAKDRLPDGLGGLTKNGQLVAIKGRLKPGPADCTLIGCDDGCCNGCDFEWIVIPRRDCPDRKLRVRRVGDHLPLRGGAMDCAVHEFGLRFTHVIVAGRIAGDDLIDEAELCRLVDDPRNEDQLKDADYDRLMSGGYLRRACPPIAEPR
jgi:hypothetical protein